MSTRAKAAQPDRIWLQDGCTCGRPACVCDPDEDVYDAEVTWCRDQINTSDSEYLRATPERTAAPTMLEALTLALSAIDAGRSVAEQESVMSVVHLCDEAEAVARAAIRQATGEGA